MFNRLRVRRRSGQIQIAIAQTGREEARQCGTRCKESSKEHEHTDEDELAETGQRGQT